MIINQIDLGAPSHPWLKPVNGQEIGTVTIEGTETITWPRGSVARKQNISFQAKAWQPMGGAAAGSQQAAKYLLKQVEELASSRDQQPCFVQFTASADPAASLNTSDLHDGWYIIENFEPDYQNFVVSGIVACRMSVTEVAPAPPRRTSMAYSGGALASNFSGAAINALALPVGSTALEPALTRQTAEGPISCIFAPVASPEPFVPPTSLANLYKGGVHVYDTISTSAFAVPAGASIQTLFRSLGTDATGTLNAWVASGGFSIAANVATITAANNAVAGHADWWDCTYAQRVIWQSGGAADVYVHSGSSIGLNSIYGSLGSAAFTANKFVNGVYSGLGTVATFSPVNNTPYWIKITCAGTSYTFALYNDSAGAIGSLIGSATFTVSDASIQTGQIAVSAETTSQKFGGAFANVCQVTGPAPAGWTTLQIIGEPAFCWSKASPYSGSYSLSIYGVTATNSRWLGPTFSLVGGTGYTFSGQYRTTGTTAPQVWLEPGDVAFAQPGLSSSWTPFSFSYTPPSSGSSFGFALEIGSGTGSVYFDNVIVTLTSNISTFTFGDGFEPERNANWVEVFGTDHDFVGDCVVSNGLLLLVFMAGINPTCYFWNTALATPTWNKILGLAYFDSAGNGPLGAKSYTLVRVAAEECALSTYVLTSGNKSSFWTVRLQRGRFEGRLDVRAITEANSAQWMVRMDTFNNGMVPKLVYNESGITDESFGTANLAFTGVYGYAVVFGPATPGSGLAGFFYQNQPAIQGAPTAAGMDLGDTSGPALNAQRSYGFFAIPYGVSGTYSTANLQAEAESGTLGTGWTSQAGAGGNSNALEAKCASGTVATNADTFGTAFIPAPGTYDVWFRVKVTTNVGSALEMTLGLWDNDSSAFVASGSTTFNRTAMTTSYAWYRAATAVTPTATKNMRFRAVTALTLGTDWFIDEAVLVPKTLTDDKRGPQDLFQQFIYDRSVRMVRQ